MYNLGEYKDLSERKENSFIKEINDFVEVSKIVNKIKNSRVDRESTLLNRDLIEGNLHGIISITQMLQVV